MKDLFAKTFFLVNAIVRILIPPFYSFERLEKYCKAQIEKYPKLFLPRWFLADLYKNNEKYEEARRVYNEIKKLGIMQQKELLDFGYILFKLEDYYAVVDTLLPIVDEKTNDKNSSWFLGVSLMKVGKYDKAIPYIERVIELGSRRYEDYWYLGFCYHQNKNYENALNNYRSALTLRPDSEELRKNMALAFIDKGKVIIDEDIELAEEDFRKALDINPNDSDATRLLEKVERIKKLDQKINMVSGRNIELS